MINLNFKLYLENFLNYQGNCVNSFDDNGSCLIGTFDDVSDFAYVEENSQIVDFSFFNKMTNNFKLPEGNYIFYFHKNRNILMAYNKNSDVHYFFH